MKSRYILSSADKAELALLDNQICSLQRQIDLLVQRKVRIYSYSSFALVPESLEEESYIKSFNLPKGLVSIEEDSQRIVCTKAKNLQGAERYGECISCGETDKDRVYKIEFWNEKRTDMHSLRICIDCFRNLQQLNLV